MMTMMESAARHLAAGVMDLDELARLVEQDTGKVPSRNTLKNSRSHFRRYGVGWCDVQRAQTKEASKRRYETDPEKVREANRRWKTDNPASHLLRNCRGNARKRGLDFALTVEGIEGMLAPMTCSATGLPLTWEHDGSTRANPWAPSIDRLDCSRGYVPGNVRVVCWAFNMMRGDFPEEVVMALAKAVAARAP